MLASYNTDRKLLLCLVQLMALGSKNRGILFNIVIDSI